MSDDEKIKGDLDISAWDAEEPPVDFAERVVRSARAEGAGASGARAGGRLRAYRPWLAGIGIAAAAAMGLLYAGTRPEPAGEASASDVRREVQIGDRAVRVLEPGARVRWSGSKVDQVEGDVFYRVERGDGFRVHTTAGDVDVKGTCFRVTLAEREKEKDMTRRDLKVGAAGAVAAAAMLVAVYEGKVAVSHAKESVTLTAGERATASEARGVVVAKGVASGARSGNGEPEEALETANRNLVESVSDYRARLERLETQKKELEKRLTVAQEKLDAERRGPDAAPRRHEYDLSQDDLVALAKDGTIKFISPCSKKDYRPDADTLQTLGLAPGDADVIAAAYKKTLAWREAQMRPMCQEALGKSELTERMPVSGCMHAVADLLSETDNKARREAQQLAADIRAGLKPTPGPNEKLPVLTRMMLVSTQQAKVLEDEIAKSLGREEAHRIVFSEKLCMGQSSWGGSPSK